MVHTLRLPTLPGRSEKVEAGGLLTRTHSKLSKLLSRHATIEIQLGLAIEICWRKTHDEHNQLKQN